MGVEFARCERSARAGVLAKQESEPMKLQHSLCLSAFAAVALVAAPLSAHAFVPHVGALGGEPIVLAQGPGGPGGPSGPGPSGPSAGPSGPGGGPAIQRAPGAMPRGGPAITGRQFGDRTVRGDRNWRSERFARRGHFRHGRWHGRRHRGFNPWWGGAFAAAPLYGWYCERVLEPRRTRSGRVVMVWVRRCPSWYPYW
jgi:hypothetical protein